MMAAQVAKGVENCESPRGEDEDKRTRNTDGKDILKIAITLTKDGGWDEAPGDCQIGDFDQDQHEHWSSEHENSSAAHVANNGYNPQEQECNPKHDYQEEEDYGLEEEKRQEGHFEEQEREQQLDHQHASHWQGEDREDGSQFHQQYAEAQVGNSCQCGHSCRCGDDGGTCQCHHEQGDVDYDEQDYDDEYHNEPVDEYDEPNDHRHSHDRDY